MFKNLARLVVLAIVCVLLARKAGEFLVVEHLHPADVIVVLAGDNNDVRYSRALELLRQGYAPRILLDESEDNRWFGHTVADLTRQFIAQDAAIAQQVSVCPIRQDSTEWETNYVEKCVGSGRSVLLVTSDYHTRRALSIFQKRLRDHQFYIAAAHDPARFGTRWWEHREWAKTTLLEWQKFLWWKLVESWR
jgi:DUF218 domain